MPKVTDLTAPHIDLHTGAWQGPYFEAAMALALSKSRKARQPFALLWLDVDDLQEHNDLHGQAVLDQALARLVSELAACVNGRGPIGRLGPDDFAIYLSALPASEVQTLTQALVRRARSQHHLGPSQSFRLTVSVGVAFAKIGEPAGNLLDAAKDACTRAKQSGRNAIVTR